LVDVSHDVPVRGLVQRADEGIGCSFHSSSSEGYNAALDSHMDKKMKTSCDLTDNSSFTASTVTDMTSTSSSSCSKSIPWTSLVLSTSAASSVAPCHVTKDIDVHNWKSEKNEDFNDNTDRNRSPGTGVCYNHSKNSTSDPHLVCEENTFDANVSSNVCDGSINSTRPILTTASSYTTDTEAISIAGPTLDQDFDSNHNSNIFGIEPGSDVNLDVSLCVSASGIDGNGSASSNDVLNADDTPTSAARTDAVLNHGSSSYVPEASSR